MSCGTGKDSLLMLRFGISIDAYERNPVIYYLLCFYQQLMSSIDDFPSNKLSIHLGSPTENKIPIKPDVIYFDPMYGDGAIKKAAPRSQMASFRKFVGVDQDYLEELSKAIQLAVNRVVLKRPMNSKVLLGEKFSHSIFGRSTRYDVYMKL